MSRRGTKRKAGARTEAARRGKSRKGPARSGATRKGKSRPRRRRRRAGEQLNLLQRGTWGGWRPGAGRPKKPDAGVSHLTRPRLTRHQAALVTWRVLRGLPNLRAKKRYRALERALRAGKERFGFRLVAFSVQRDHLHLVAEADDEKALSRGLQGLGVRLAKALNRVVGRKGRVMRNRYHGRVLRSPREVRNALAYTLNNRRKHALQGCELLPEGWWDACSSARCFDGWKNLTLARPPPEDRPVTRPKSWLLRKGWRKHGLIEAHAIPSLGSMTRR